MCVYMFVCVTDEKKLSVENSVKFPILGPPTGSRASPVTRQCVDIYVALYVVSDGRKHRACGGNENNIPSSRWNVLSMYICTS